MVTTACPHCDLAMIEMFDLHRRAKGLGCAIHGIPDTKGDSPGHPFRGNQFGGPGGGSGGFRPKHPAAFAVGRAMNAVKEYDHPGAHEQIRNALQTLSATRHSEDHGLIAERHFTAAKRMLNAADYHISSGSDMVAHGHLQSALDSLQAGNDAFREHFSHPGHAEFLTHP